MMRERLLLEAENLLCKDMASISRKETIKERAKVFALNLKMDLITAYEVRMLSGGPHDREGTFWANLTQIVHEKYGSELEDEVQVSGGNVYVRRIEGIKAKKNDYIGVRMWLKGYEAILYRKEENGKYRSIVSAIIRSKRVKNDGIIYKMGNITYYRTTNEKKAVLLRIDDLPRLTKGYDKMNED